MVFRINQNLSWAHKFPGHTRWCLGSRTWRLETDAGQTCKGLPYRCIDQIQAKHFETPPRSLYDDVGFGHLGKIKLHGTHRLAVKSGAVFCWRCGAYAQQRVKLLKGPCRKQPQPKGKQVLSFIRAGRTVKGAKAPLPDLIFDKA